MLSSSISSLKNTLKRKKASDSSYKRFDTPASSIHDPSRRPVEVIEEQMSEISREIPPKEESKHSSFDQESLSTHNSVDHGPFETVLICNEHGKILHGDNEESDQDKANYGKKDVVNISELCKNDDDLSLNLDESMFGDSILDRALGHFKEDTTNPSETKSASVRSSETTTGALICPASDDTKHAFEEGRVQEEPEVVDEPVQSVQEISHLTDKDQTYVLDHKTFAHVGNLLFQEQPDRSQTDKKGSSSLDHTSNSIVRPTDSEKKDTISISGGVHKKKSHGNGDVYGVSLFLDHLMLFGKAVFALHAAYGYWALWCQSDPIYERVVGEEIHHDCSEELFHYAMQSAPKPFLDKDGTASLASHNFVTMCALFVACFATAWARRVSRGEGEESKLLMNSKQGVLRTPRKHTPTIQRETASLETKNVFSSSFTADFVMSSGEIKSVRRSGRIASSEAAKGYAEDSKCSAVDLMKEFNAEPKKEDPKRAQK